MMSSLKSSMDTEQESFKASDQQFLDKGKGKAPEEDVDTDENGSSSEEDAEAEEAARVVDEDRDDDDNMEEIDLNNIVGRRTRGRKIDFAKAAEEQPIDEDDDEDEDDDFELIDDEDRMEE